ncbi:GntR family transcriptional regulator [Kineococcus sp. NUM-3379]
MAQQRTGARVPRYRVIADDLGRRIRSGEFSAGGALPAQRDLAAGYEVTLMTLRQALGTLREEGLVVQQAGRGTFVAPQQPAYRTDTLRSFAEDLREQGHDVDTRVLATALRAAPPAVAQVLGVDAGARVLRLERLRLLGGRPAVHQVSWVPQPHADRVRGRDLAGTSLYAALADAGVHIARASERITPEVLAGAAAGHLAAEPGTAALHSERVTYDPDDVPVVLDHASMLGELVEVRAERARSAVSVTWGAAPRR